MFASREQPVPLGVVWDHNGVPTKVPLFPDPEESETVVPAHSSKFHAPTSWSPRAWYVDAANCLAAAILPFSRAELMLASTIVESKPKRDTTTRSSSKVNPLFLLRK